MTKNNEGPDFPPALEISGIIYGEDLAVDALHRQGYTEKTSGLLRGLLARRRRNVGPGARETSSGNILRIVRDEGEVVDEKE